MHNERMTLEGMTAKHPDQWLFVIDCEISKTIELLSRVVSLIINCETILMKPLDIMKGAQRYIMQVNSRRDALYVISLDDTD